MGLSVEEVDLLTGTLIGRPKSGIFRTADIVGFNFSSSTNSLGITSGSIGSETFSYSTNSLGITSGSVGGNSFSCSTNKNACSRSSGLFKTSLKTKFA